MTQELKYPQLIVDEYTSPIEGVAEPQMSLSACKELIENKGYRHLPVIENGNVVGIVSQRDINLYLHLESNNNQAIVVKDIMHSDIFVVDYNTPIEKVVFQMSDRKIGSAIVRDAEGQLNGIFTTTDAMNALIEIIYDKKQR